MTRPSYRDIPKSTQDLLALIQRVLRHEDLNEVREHIESELERFFEDARIKPLEFFDGRDYELAHEPRYKVSLLPGGSQTHETGGPNDEGFSRTTTSWYLGFDGVVTKSVYTDSRDCDGPHSSWSEYRSHADSLDALGGLPFQRVSASQRDVFAERAGY